MIPYMGNIWQVKFWQNMQVKAIGEQKFGERATVSAYVIYVFSVSMNVGEEYFGKWLKIHQIRQFFPCQNFPVYDTASCSQS